MLPELSFLALGLVLLLLGGEALVHSSVAIARRLRISTVIVGIVVVGFGTSSPELLVSIQASFSGVPDIAVGNVVGSNVANLLLILGAAAAICPLPSKDKWITSTVMIMILCSIIMMCIFLTGQITRSMGVMLLLGLSLVLFYSIHQERRSASSAPALNWPADSLDRPLLRVMIFTLLALVALFILGLLMMIIGSNMVVLGATGIARGFGVSEAVIGLTIVAIGTSLPELSTAVVASYRRHPEVILANVIGSNIFNILCILGTTAVLIPIPISERFSARDGPLMLAVTLVVSLFLLKNSEIRRQLGFILLSFYALYLLQQGLEWAIF